MQQQGSDDDPVDMSQCLQEQRAMWIPAGPMRLKYMVPPGKVKQEWVLVLPPGAAASLQARAAAKRQRGAARRAAAAAAAGQPAAKRSCLGGSLTQNRQG